MSNIRYSKATISDVNRIARARNDMSKESPYVSCTSPDEEYKFFQSEIKHTSAYILLAEEEDNRIAGMLVLSPSLSKENELVIWRLGVLNEFSGRGIATNMIRHVLESSKASGEYSRVALTVAEDNSKAYELYSRIGFAKMGKVRADDHDSFYMVYSLK